MSVLATFEDVQNGFEKPIPNTLKPKVEEFLARASRRLHVMVGAQLQTAVDRAKIEWALLGATPETEPVVLGFVRDLVVQAAESKLRNFGGFSSESAGVFSVTRDDYWAKGRIDFEDKDLELLSNLIDETYGETAVGPIYTGVPAYRWPR